MSTHISIQINNHLPSPPSCQPRVHALTCPAETQAGALVRLCGEGELWQDKDVLMVSAGRVILADDSLHEGMIVDILPLVDGG